MRADETTREAYKLALNSNLCESAKWLQILNIILNAAAHGRGGSRIDGRGVLVRLASHGLRVQARQLGDLGACPPRKMLEF